MKRIINITQNVKSKLSFVTFSLSVRFAAIFLLVVLFVLYKIRLQHCSAQHWRRHENRKALMSLLFSFFFSAFAVEVRFIICLEWVWSTSEWVPWSITLTRSDQIKTQQKLISYLLRCCISLFPQSRERESITNHLITFASNGYRTAQPLPQEPCIAHKNQIKSCSFCILK